MRTSQVFIPTLREDPGEAEIVSHRLMLRAGLIRKVASGLYTYLPLGLRVIRKIERIIREEMENGGAQELLMPILSPAELWQESGRWGVYGKELLRCRDRHEREFCLGPTHEEIITDLFRREVRSYRQLPLNCFQIQTKFRDEIRPRFGLMRGREFIMKDAYSFDLDEEGAKRNYQKMYDAYERIFTRCGLQFRAVQADNGMIGGNMSHEFMVLADTGEETILYDEHGTFATNVELAEVQTSEQESTVPYQPQYRVQTPGTKTVEEVCNYLGVAPNQLVKTLLYQTEANNVIAVLIRGDHEANEIKIRRMLGVAELTLADPETVQTVSSAPVGFAGPVGLTNVPILADHAIRGMRNFIVGGNDQDIHLRDVNWGRDFQIETFADIRKAQAGGPSPSGDAPLLSAKGIEVGHVFLLGTKYSQAMGATYLDPQGKDRLAIMGCYGIGIGRTAAACIEQHHDHRGITWPVPIAPFHIHLISVSASDNALKTTQDLYTSLVQSDIEVLWDDRDERAGVKFNDADLIGAPLQIVIGDKGLTKGTIDVKVRKTGERSQLPPQDILPFVSKWLAEHSSLLRPQ
ncbi:MAG: proline--tRNA ligase [Nitrospirales bacterium]|nr:proline--tRNA ligase [Nitrospirales bacterium]